MFYIKMADLLICIDNHYEYVKNMCRDYIVEPEAVCSESTEPARADMYIQVSCEDIEKEQEESRKKALLTMQRNANRILNLINQLLDIRKIDKGQMKSRMS